MFEEKYVALIDDVIETFGRFDLLPDGVERQSTDSHYVRAHRHEYIRTLQDVDRALQEASGRKILELGAFFGVVSIALARLGYQVTASDVPDYTSGHSA